MYVAQYEPLLAVLDHTYSLNIIKFSLSEQTLQTYSPGLSAEIDSD